MYKTICFDLETIADKSVIPLLPPVEAKRNLKDPAKIKADIEQKEADRLSKLGLDPATARICCFGWFDGEAGKAYNYMLEAETLEAEKKLLQKAWDILSTGDHFVTFNGNQFDVPMLLMRSLVNHVRPAIQISTKKYTITNHTDVRAVLNNWNDYKPGTLDFYSRLLLGRTPKGDFDGSQVQDMWDMELYDDIAKYCMDDCEPTYQIFELMQKYYL